MFSQPSGGYARGIDGMDWLVAVGAGSVEPVGCEVVEAAVLEPV
jgi:hypothetical protein